MVAGNFNCYHPNVENGEMYIFMRIMATNRRDVYLRIPILWRQRLHFAVFYVMMMGRLLSRVLRGWGGCPPGEHIDIVHTGGYWWGCSLVDWLRVEPHNNSKGIKALYSDRPSGMGGC